MAKQYLDLDCTSSSDKQRKGMSLELVAIVCFYVACNEKDGNDPRSIEQIRVAWTPNLLHCAKGVIYNKCFDLVCQILGKSVNVLESNIKRFARQTRLPDAMCEAAFTRMQPGLQHISRRNERKGTHHRRCCCSL